MRTFFDRRPWAAVAIIYAVDIAFVLGGAALLSMWFPNIPGYGYGLSQSLILVLVGVLVVAAWLSAGHFWRRAGFVGPSEWRDLRLFWLPALLVFVPFVAGIRPLPTDALLTLMVAYAATAFFEEGTYRGLILGLLRPRGVWTSVIVSSLLFGLVHLTNIVLRGNPGLIALQALGAATDGVGMAALRIRTRTVWPGIALHAVHDLFLQMSHLPIPLMEAVYAIVLLGYGIYLLRPSVLARLEAEPAATGTTPPAGPVGVAIE